MAAVISGCGSSDAAPPAGGAGASGAGAPGAGAGGGAAAGAAGAAAGAGGGSTLTGNATNGAALWKKSTLACNGCHGEHAEGGGAPNITKSVAGGIGAFTQAQFHAAVREGKNKEGGKLCMFMVAFDATAASEQDIADLYAFQQAQPAVDTPVTSPVYCANACCTGEHK